MSKYCLPTLKWVKYVFNGFYSRQTHIKIYSINIYINGSQNIPIIYSCNQYLFSAIWEKMNKRKYFQTRIYELDLPHIEVFFLIAYFLCGTTRNGDLPYNLHLLCSPIAFSLTHNNS